MKSWFHRHVTAATTTAVFLVIAASGLAMLFHVGEGS
jgi:hypothetical protein